jgi:hypothetical protein
MRRHFADVTGRVRGPLEYVAQVHRHHAVYNRLGADGQDARANGGGRRYLTLAGSPGG